ncbi:MAG: hypothetical protein CMI54_00785 [Parcubacteria group bacterium]|jgi:endonuclease YncB( thermonuclease family)|nr:hypothetical protein [Parcubacteria group bacterium]|tara:strand:+ start:8155 stop:8604 length:450 start_codon:yes stop_codon:yes gene_type:complete
MVHDFKKFPELTNAQMAEDYFNSPHKQIVEDFRADVVKVHDGDTITLKWKERDFKFPVRIINIAAPELKEDGGKESQSWLEQKILGRMVDIKMNQYNRVDKWGRLLGAVELMGVDVGEESILAGQSVNWGDRNDGKLPDFEKEMEEVWS